MRFPVETNSIMRDQSLLLYYATSIRKNEIALAIYRLTFNGFRNNSIGRSYVAGKLGHNELASSQYFRNKQLRHLNWFSYCVVYNL